ncbi:hypothetical protein NL108_016202 [Boleophthalmus pectinirostris]|nr:hypothetical protein NL108_016202 [Boleophthalmus pectinirostris]
MCVGVICVQDHNFIKCHEIFEKTLSLSFYFQMFVMSRLCSVLCPPEGAHNRSEVGGASCYNGIVEARLRGEWRRVESSGLWDHEAATAVCRDLDCGSAVHGEQRDDFHRVVCGGSDLTV